MSGYAATPASEVKRGDILDHQTYGMVQVLEVWKLPTGDIEFYIKQTVRSQSYLILVLPQTLMKVVK